MLAFLEEVKVGSRASMIMSTWSYLQLQWARRMFGIALQDAEPTKATNGGTGTWTTPSLGVRRCDEVGLRQKKKKVRIQGQMSSFACQTAVKCEIQSCDDSVTESSEEGEHNEWNRVLALLTDIGCSPAPQPCLQ